MNDLQQTKSIQLQQQVNITFFQKEHQSQVNSLMESIALEFDEPIFTAQSKKIIEVFSLPNNTFWVATKDSNVIGTIGMTKLTNSNIVLKSMFVSKAYRGHGISNLLLARLINEAIQNRCKKIYLGTMSQFAGGQRFYEKNGFIQCKKEELPTDFITNPLDTVFYTRNLD